MSREVETVRDFGTGATRDSNVGKYDYIGFLSPQVLVAFAGYMHKHRQMPDGTVRGSDNWKSGIPVDAYLESLARHFIDLWLLLDGSPLPRPETGEVPTLADTLGGLLFNVQGAWHELLKEGKA